MFINFAETKTLASILAVAEWLKLDVKNNRCQCPHNEGDKREMSFTPDKDLWKCWGCNQYGDQIALTSHILQIDQKKAALEIQAHFRNYRPVVKGLPENGLDYLEPKHEAVQALGIGEKSAGVLGIGFAPKGTMKGHILFPIRDKQGKLQGYIGYSPAIKTLKVPSSMKE